MWMYVGTTVPSCSDSQSRQRATPGTATIARITVNLNNPSSCNAKAQKEQKQNSAALCAECCKHTADYWKLHMGHILEQKLEAAKSKDNAEVKNNKQSREQQERSTERHVF